MSSPPICVAAFYQFHSVHDVSAIQVELTTLCERHEVLGTIIIAKEGVNGTIAGSGQGVRQVIDGLRRMLGITSLDYKYSTARRMPFYRLKIKCKAEIVTMGVNGVDPASQTGEHVEPKDWNALIQDPDVLVIDARNDYEVEVGAFEGAVDPGTQHFRELPAWLQHYPGLASKPRVAMYCTGGIRCEKASAWLKQQGFDEVYQLKGGVLKYLEDIPAEQSLWHGECFVFDERVTVTHGLAEGTHELCRACRYPVSVVAMRSPHYVEGVSCPRCHSTLSAEKKARFAERQRQVELAAARGQTHIAQSFADDTPARSAAVMTTAEPELPVLYSFRRCPYAMRARLAIKVSGIRCELREVALKQKPQAMLTLSPKATVPVLALTDGTVLEQSLDIMDWALRINDPHAWLIPEHDTVDGMRALVSAFDNAFKHHLDRYKYASRFPETVADQERDAAARLLAPLEARLLEGAYLFGNRQSLADIAIAPFIRQFANTDRDWFDHQPWPRLLYWLNAFTESPLFASIMDKYPPWTPEDDLTVFP